jgi:predicted MPP superfamily phosphohydrolase
MALVAKLITPVSLSLPGLPVSLEGLRIVHLSDLHIHRRRGRHRRIMATLEQLEVDLVVLTGDYITFPSHEAIGFDVMSEICGVLRAKHGVFGVFGNHDTHQLQQHFRELPVHWLQDACAQPDGMPLQILGFNAAPKSFPDPVATLADIPDGQGEDNRKDTPDGHSRPLRILLSHFPTYLPTAADLGVDLMFSGHTHGGQCRLPGARALVNSTDLPRRLTSGILRHRDTLCIVSRGLGEMWLPLRLFCPPHIPVYTLRRGPLPGQSTEHIENVMPW